MKKESIIIIALLIILIIITSIFLNNLINPSSQTRYLCGDDEEYYRKIENGQLTLNVEKCFDDCTTLCSKMGRKYKNSGWTNYDEGLLSDCNQPYQTICTCSCWD